MGEKKYSVLYYDVENTDLDYLVELLDQIKAFHEKENIYFFTSSNYCKTRVDE